MFSTKYLIGFLGVGAVASGVAAISLRNLDSGKETKNDIEVPKTSTAIPPIQHIQQEPKETKFEGTLVFSKGNKNAGFSRLGEVFYQGKIFNNEEYKQKEAQLKDSRKEDPENHITVEVNLEKPKEEIEIKLQELNKKIEKKSRERQNQKTTLDRFEEILKGVKDEFEEIFDSNIYKNLLEKIKELQKPKTITE